MWYTNVTTRWRCGWTSPVWTACFMIRWCLRRLSHDQRDDMAVGCWCGCVDSTLNSTVVLPSLKKSAKGQAMPAVLPSGGTPARVQDTFQESKQKIKVLSPGIRFPLNLRALNDLGSCSHDGFSTGFILNLHVCSDRGFWKCSWAPAAIPSRETLLFFQQRGLKTTSIQVWPSALTLVHRDFCWFSDSFKDFLHCRSFFYYYFVSHFPSLQSLLVFDVVTEPPTLTMRRTINIQCAMIITKQGFIKAWWYNCDTNFTGAL